MLWLTSNVLQSDSYTRVCVLCLVAQSCPALCDPMDCSPPGFPVHGDSPGKNIGSGCHALLQGIFPTRDHAQPSCVAGGFFTVLVTREALVCVCVCVYVCLCVHAHSLNVIFHVVYHRLLNIVLCAIQCYTHFLR